MRPDGQGDSPVESRRVDRVEFVGEQDGPAERKLKLALAPILARHGVSRAYLAQIRVAQPDESVVALCLVGEERPEVVAEIGNIFRALFGAQSHLDILFLAKHQQVEILTVCRPFYVAA